LHKVELPPGTLEVDVNFYADKTEVTNIDYREYLFWVRRVFGSSSIEFLEAKPDSFNRMIPYQYGEPMVSNYFWHPAYNNYPVVGVNLNQAKKYTEWRTDKVAQVLLMDKGLISFESNRDSFDFFTIEKYLEGEANWIVKREAIPIPIYKVPDVLEWEKLAGVDSNLQYGTDNLLRYNRSVLRENNCLYYTKEFNNNDMPFYAPTFSKNIFGLYGVVGNVAELVDNENTVKGGSWRDKIIDIDIKQNMTVDEPKYWVGFRNICSFELMRMNGS